MKAGVLAARVWCSVLISVFVSILFHKRELQEIRLVTALVRGLRFVNSKQKPR
jgi:hypothetical protein